ncbi:hypothetical protein AA0118_g519 [Alternaria tenuissima]|nr:hypothetical protein AA0118_g519 [Alternaria tenuissima]
MFGYKLLAIAALVLAVVAADSVCAPAATMTATVTITECIPQPGKPSYAPPPAESVVSSALSSGLFTTSVILPPLGHPIPTSVTPPASSTLIAPSGETSGASASSTASVTTTVVATSSSGRPGEPEASSTSSPPETAGAALATPAVGMGSLVAMGAAALAVMA